ncbi:hypothetical protein GCM10010124_31210 [Pilimelia terevasa]|uniref:Uncharacterized protein n=1 Tax=Pilimelia terevasa TaxID=53372 RepID=A0A8J3FJC5_9ACTN|nr:hypothetical protein [Pilimelia terevasa]GGK36343.1 hypothetical protein GCM10010124_31210 [Pilimelia terevasa]
MQLDAVLTRAAATLAIHRPDPGGWCAGCLDDAARLAAAPCPAARRAAAVLAVPGRHTAAPTAGTQPGDGADSSASAPGRRRLATRSTPPAHLRLLPTTTQPGSHR